MASQQQQQQRSMPRYACPVCGDPSAFPLWIDSEPPPGCPQDESAMNGGPRTIRNVGECAWQRRKAEQAALFRRCCPDAFDENGNMKPGRLPDVLASLPPGTTLIL